MGLRLTRHLVLWDIYVWICRGWAILTAIGLWGVGIEAAYMRFELGIYLLVAAFVMTFVETIFIVQFWLELFLREEKPGCIDAWSKLGWLDCWKKGVLYLLMSVGCFLQPKSMWPATITGVMLIVTSILYFVKTIKWRQEKREEELRNKNQTYDRFDEVQDDIDENVMGSITGSLTEQPIYSPESLAEQDEILDV